MISAILAGDRTPYERACASGCPNTVSTDDKPAIGAVTGHIDDKIYYSKCLLAEGLEESSPWWRRPVSKAGIARSNGTLASWLGSKPC
jgi:hypothetical protein